jgi:hypothetical protein
VCAPKVSLGRSEYGSARRQSTAPVVYGAGCKTDAEMYLPAFITSKDVKRRRIIGAAAVIMAVTLLVWNVGTPGENTGASAFVPGGASRRYATNFILNENPISENGNWTNGQTVGLDWANIRTTAGLAFGTDSGTSKYTDSTALLAGPWGPDQTVEATVHSVNQNDHIYEEVELRLRSSLSPHRATGYEITFRCSKTKDAYCQIVRWNGPVGKFRYLSEGRGAHYGVGQGDVVRATIVGNVIMAYINGAQVLRATDSTFTSGSPGMGAYLEGSTGVNRDFGLTRVTATDEPATHTRAVAGPATGAATAQQLFPAASSSDARGFGRWPSVKWAQ